MGKRKRQRERQREILHWAQSGLCAGCARPIGLGRKGPRLGPTYPTFDHYDPKHLDGRRTVWNGLLKHRRCNEARGGRMPTGCDTIWHWNLIDRLRTPQAIGHWPDQLAGGHASVLT